MSLLAASRYDETHRQLPREAQIVLARQDARERATELRHALGTWRPCGIVADDEAICEDCGRSAFITFGYSAVRPLAGVRFFGPALVSSCRGRRPHKSEASC